MLDEICKVYIAQYKAKYSYKNNVSLVTDSIKQHNYIASSKLLENNLQQLIKEVDQMKAVAPNFKSTKHKITFDNMAEELKSAQVYFSSLNAYLTERGVETSNTNVPSEMAYLEQTKLELDSKVNYYDEIISDIRANADKITSAFNTLSSSAGGASVNIDKLVEYYKEITKYEELKAPYKTQLETINKVMAGYGASSKFNMASDEKKAEMRKNTDDMMVKICEKLTIQSEKYSEMLAEFNDVENLKKAVVLTQNSTGYSQLEISTTLFLMIALMAVLIGCVIGVARTDRKIKKYNQANVEENVTTSTDENQAE